jgi:hypothetical protein
MRWLLQLLGMFSFGWSTLIVLFTIMHRLQLLTRRPRYGYLLTTRKSPSLGYHNFLRQLPPFLKDLTEDRPLIRTELLVKTLDGGQLVTSLVDCAATFDFVSENVVRRFAMQTRKSPTKTLVRLAHGHRDTSSTVCDVTFEVTRHEFQRTF